MIEPADELLRRFRSLPAAGPLLGAIADRAAANADRAAVYLVGGAVRDLILGGDSPPDLDLLVDGDPSELVAQLDATGRTYERFGTQTFELGGFRYDLARTRSETYARPGALPTIAPADLAHDLERRDFAVHAAALGLTGRAAGTLTAVDAALPDIRARRLRVLHDASFVEDPTRLLRLARYASRLAFSIEPHTLGLAEAAIAQAALRTVTSARQGAELRLLVREPDPVAAMAQLRELGLDAALHECFGLADPPLARTALTLLPPDGSRGGVVLAAASMDLPGPELGRWLDELAFAAGERDAIVAAAGGARRLAGTLARAVRPSAIAAAVGRGRPELVALAGALGPERAARDWLEALRDVRLQIDGEDLLRAGVTPGPAVGAGLRAALAARLDGRAGDRESQLRAALAAAADSG